jgi:hypothetical protein
MAGLNIDTRRHLPSATFVGIAAALLAVFAAFSSMREYTISQATTRIANPSIGCSKSSVTSRSPRGRAVSRSRPTWAARHGSRPARASTPRCAQGAISGRESSAAR